MQIVYFPYLHLIDRDEVSFGDVKVWNFDRVGRDYIKDTDLRDHIGKLLQSNVQNEKPLGDIGVLSIGKTDFREFNDDEFRLVDEVRLIMFLGFLSRNKVNLDGENSGHWVATSENFTFAIQNFNPKSMSISQQNGFIIRKLDGGYKLGELKFHAPPFVPEPLRFSLDGELLTKLLDVKKSNITFVKRIMRATDLMFEAYFNNPHLSINARALLMCTSFEVLLNLPESGQRKEFKEITRTLTCIGSKQKIRYTSIRRRTPGWEWEVAPVKVMWADKFYTLRNKIIHGAKVKPSDFMFRNKYSHFDIAPKFFVLFVKKLLNEKIGKNYFNDDLTWDCVDTENGPYSYFAYHDSSIGRRLSRISTDS